MITRFEADENLAVKEIVSEAGDARGRMLGKDDGLI
jgi:hypothetical protein